MAAIMGHPFLCRAPSDGFRRGLIEKRAVRFKAERLEEYEGRHWMDGKQREKKGSICLAGEVGVVGFGKEVDEGGKIANEYVCVRVCVCV